MPVRHRPGRVSGSSLKINKSDCYLPQRWNLPSFITATSDAVPYWAGTMFLQGILAMTVVSFSAFINRALLKPPSFLVIFAIGELTSGSDDNRSQSAWTSKGEYRFASSYCSFTKKRPFWYRNNSSSDIRFPTNMNKRCRRHKWTHLGWRFLACVLTPMEVSEPAKSADCRYYCSSWNRWGGSALHFVVQAIKSGILSWSTSWLWHSSPQGLKLSTYFSRPRTMDGL